MLGNLHFADNFGRSLRNCGEQINELITKLAENGDLPKQLLGKDQKGDDVRIKVAPKGAVPTESSEHLPEQDYFFAHARSLHCNHLRRPTSSITARRSLRGSPIH